MSNADGSLNPNTIVLVHGLWMTPLSWEKWIARYEGRGYRVLAPSWPGMEGDVEDLRRDPSPIARQSIKEILDLYESIIRKLDEPPIIMGHSFGGTFTQILLDRGLGAAGVCVAPSTVRGVVSLPLSTLRATTALSRNPFARHKAIPITPKQFHYAFTNTMSQADSLSVYKRYAVPGSRNVLLEGAFANLNSATAVRVNFNKGDRAPMLFIAGGKDHIIPPSAAQANFKKYRDSEAITDYKEFPGRSHYLLGQDGWEEVADYALTWASEHATTNRR